MNDFFGLEIRFSAAHFYRQPTWTDERNESEFGKCYSPDFRGHGHDYRLWAEFAVVEFEMSAVQIALQQIFDELDHRHLNYHVPEFKTLVPTTENLVLLCLSRLQKTLGPQKRGIRLTLWERDDLGASVEV